MGSINKRVRRNVFWSILLFAIISCTLFSGTAFCEEAAEAVLTQAEQDFAQARALHEKLKKYEEAIVLYQSVAQNSSDSELAMKSLARAGSCEMQLGNFTAAGQLYETLINDYSTQPNLYESVHFFAGSYWGAGKYNEANNAYQIVYDNSTDRSLTFRALSGITSTYRKTGKPEKGIEICDNVLAGETDKSLPFYVHVLKLKAVCCIDIGAEEQAVALQGKIDLHSDKEFYPRMQIDIAHSYRVNDKFEKAIAVYDKIYENTTDKGIQVEALAAIAACYARLNDDSNVTASVDLLCKDFAGHEILGWAVFVTGEEYFNIVFPNGYKTPNDQERKELAKCLAIWKRIIDKPSDREYTMHAYYFSAIAYQYLKDYRKSATHYGKVFTDFPESKFAAHSLFMTGRNLEKSRRFTRGSDTAIVSNGLTDPNEVTSAVVLAESMEIADPNSVTVPVQASTAPINTARAAYKLLLEKYPDSPGAVHARRRLNKRNSR